MFLKARIQNCTTITPGTPLPEGKFNWDIEDFNPESLKMSPCGQDGKSKIFDSAADETGEQGLTVPQAQLVQAIKLFTSELTKKETDLEKACKQLDKDGKDISVANCKKQLEKISKNLLAPPKNAR